MESGFETSIFSIANDFYEAYLRCSEGENTHIDENGRTVSHYLGISAIVNGAFACELYLKSLLPKEKWKAGGHNLKVLMLSLPNDKQTQIRKNAISQLDLHFCSYEDYLNALSNSFDYWRYIHEKKDFGNLGYNGTTNALPVFLESIRNLALEKYKQHNHD